MTSKEMTYAGLYKIANEYQRHNVQTMLPYGQRRDLSPEELAMVEEGESRWIPKIFKNYSDTPDKMLASPGKQSLLFGLGAGVPLAMLGAAQTGSPAGAAAYGLGGGGLAALLAYFIRNQKNQNVIETLKRNPEGATYRDLQADPMITEERRLSAAGGGGLGSGVLGGMIAGSMMNS